MKKRHIAFVVESSHGHINPTLAITSKLAQRGYRVTYAVKDYFVPRVIASGAEAMAYRPLETKLTFFREMQKDKEGEFLFDFKPGDVSDLKRIFRKDMEDMLSQLEILYRDDKPDLIIFDRGNFAGKSLASEWEIRAIEYCPMMVGEDDRHCDADLVIVTIPEFFQDNAAELDRRFHFVGPIYNDGTLFEPWRSRCYAEKTVLISATTGLVPQVEFFSTAIRAFANLPWQIILSIGDEFDPASLGPLPANFEINQFSSQQKILEHCCLFIGQGGPGSILEALRCGVPLLLIPPSQIHDVYVRRVEELGLGIRLLKGDFSAENLRKSAVCLLQDGALLNRVKQVQKIIGESNGAEAAANLIDRYINLENA
jgi:UDP:flavonoid glycosyltransferase YjiC (YdhE family)